MDISNPENKATILLAVVAFHGPLLMGLSARRRRSGHPVLRFLLWAISTVYFPLMTYVLAYMTSYITAMRPETTRVLLLLVLVQFLRAKADLAAMAVAAVASPATADSDIDSPKIRPSAESFINTFWVAGLVIYDIFRKGNDDDNRNILKRAFVLISPLWALSACRTVLRFAAFQKATGSFALGRNVQLIDGYMLQLRQGGGSLETEMELVAALPPVPRLIVTGERNQDVEETPAGYHVKCTALRRLVTLDRVWSEGEDLLPYRDLCLSFALFKCLRRRFAGYRLAAEAGSSWAFRFVHDGLLAAGGQEDNNNDERIFRVIAGELSFASDFFYSPLPVASLGATAAALHFLLSLLSFSILIFAALIIVSVIYYVHYSGLSENSGAIYPLLSLALVLVVVNASTEVSEMVDSVRSNWTKISIIGHYVRCRHRCSRRFFACLLKRKPPKFWKDEIQQTELLSTRIKNKHKDIIKVPVEVKKAILRSFRGSGGQLSDGAAAVRRRCQDITWACRDGGEVVTTTDAILVWHIATSLFDIKCSSSSSPKDSADGSSSTTANSAVVVARSLSRYCAHLVAEAPDVLPDNSAWIKRRYEAVKKGIEEASKSSGHVPESGGVYGHLIDCFRAEGCHEVLKKGSRLGKQLVEEAERQQRSGEEDAGAGGEDAVWELLSEFWSEMVLYLAPSDNVKGHIEALQCGGELITLLWVLLLHAGITSRPTDTTIENVSTGSKSL